MTTWTKIKPTRPGAGRVKRTSPAVTKYKTGGAILVLPEGVTSAKKADIFTDGNGKLGFTFSDDGLYSVYKVNKASAAQRITIPSAYSSRIPLGTTDVTLSNDGVITVLDLSQFAPA